MKKVDRASDRYDGRNALYIHYAWPYYTVWNWGKTLGTLGKFTPPCIVNPTLSSKTPTPRYFTKF